MKAYAQFIAEARTTKASSQAKRLGLVGDGHGDWYDKQGNLKAKTVSEICDEILELKENTKIMIMAPVIRGKKGEHLGIYEELRKSGYVRVKINGIVYPIEEFPSL